MPIWETVDGRELNLRRLLGPLYKMRGGVVTQKWCPKCHLFLATELFYIKDGKIASWCKECDLGRKVGGSKRLYLDTLTTRDAEGLEVIPCKHCGKKIYVNELRISKGDRTCRTCYSQRRWGKSLLGRVGKAHGEESGEYLLAKDEKRYYHLKALCRLLGVVSHNGVHSKKEKCPVLRVLPKLSYPEIRPEEREKAYWFIDKWAEIEQKTHQEGRRWTADVQMRAMQEIQV